MPFAKHQQLSPGSSGLLEVPGNSCTRSQKRSWSITCDEDSFQNAPVQAWKDEVSSAASRGRLLARGFCSRALLRVDLSTQQTLQEPCSEASLTCPPSFGGGGPARSNTRVRDGPVGAATHSYSRKIFKGKTHTSGRFVVYCY